MRPLSPRELRQKAEELYKAAAATAALRSSGPQNASAMIACLPSPDWVEHPLELTPRGAQELAAAMHRAAQAIEERRGNGEASESEGQEAAARVAPRPEGGPALGAIVVDDRRRDGGR